MTNLEEGEERKKEGKKCVTEKTGSITGRERNVSDNSAVEQFFPFSAIQPLQ